MMCARGEAEIMSTRHRIANIQHFHSIMHIDSIYIGHPASHHARDRLLRPNKNKTISLTRRRRRGCLHATNIPEATCYRDV